MTRKTACRRGGVEHDAKGTPVRVSLGRCFKEFCRSSTFVFHPAVALFLKSPKHLYVRTVPRVMETFEWIAISKSGLINILIMSASGGAFENPTV